ncbi:hypothetical protein [Micromonospora sp. NPDC007230]|uniref:hypothetical protein n=1 Tax=Micromonospora sp. NPDC007230 TaxID=3364237 RepID=UPI00369CB962
MELSNRRNRSLLLVAALIAATIGASVLFQPSAHGEEPSEVRDQVLRHQQLVAECMESRGFEYVATVPGDLIIEEARAAAEATGSDVKAAVEEASQNLPPDPNELHVATLEPGQQQAWGDALWGTDSLEGCYDSTLETASRVDLEAELDRAQSILDQVESDPSVQGAEAEYLTCMAAHGYSLNSVDSIHEYVGLRAEELDAEAGQELADQAYAHHDDCVRQYNATFNTVHLSLLGGN